MPSNESNHRTNVNRQQVGEIAISALLGAALMLYFGWGCNWYRPVEETLYSRSILLFMWVLRAGGLLMALAAVGLWTGFPLVLIYDAVVASLIGALMAAIGALWLANSDMQGILLLVFGVLFARSGWGSWHTFRAAGRGYESPVAPRIDTAETPLPIEPVDPVARQAAMDRLLASKKREGAADPVPVPTPARERETAPAPEPVARPAITKAANPARPPAKLPPMPKEEPPPPDGFLAQLGRDDS